jgi:heat shock protein HtpX
MGLYGHIQSNRRKSFVLIVGLFFLIFFLTVILALIFSDTGYGPPARHIARAFMLAAAVSHITFGLTALWVFIGFELNTAIIASVMQAQPLTRKDNPEIYNLLENLCISRGMAMPMLNIIEDEALNAFASGTNPKQYTITLTRGLINALNKQELEAVIAHELTHIMNGDVRLMIIAMLIVGVISFVSELMLRGLFRLRGEGKTAGLFAFILLLFIGFLSTIIQLSLSRSREYLADAGAVELTKNPDAMISALLKISGRSELDAPASLMEMCIDNDANGAGDMFSTHPSITKRVQALVETAGGRLPPLHSRTPLPEIVQHHPALSKGGDVPVFGGKTPFVPKN